MKRILVLVSCVALFLTGCGNAQQELIEKNQQLEQQIKSLEEQIVTLESKLLEATKAEETEKSATEEPISDEEKYYSEYQSKIILSKEEFEAFYETVELTLDNWNQYLEIYEKEVIEKDAFGDPTGEEYYYYFLRVREEYQNRLMFAEKAKFNIYVSAYSEINIYDEGELVNSFVNDYEGKMDSFTLDESKGETYLSYSRTETISDGKRWVTVYKPGLEMQKVGGKLCLLNIPEEKWNQNESGERYLLVLLESGHYCLFYEDGESMLDLGETQEYWWGSEVGDWNLDYLNK